MSANATSPSAGEHQALWFRFIVGRAVGTGALLLVLVAVQGVVPPPTSLPLYLLALTQFAVNGVYLYLWRKRDLALLGYLIFGLEIILISLLIFVLGVGGAYFLLGYLWPIMMGGWLIGPRAVLPLTLLASVAYAALIVLEQLGVQPAQNAWSPSNAPLGAVLGLVYLISVALVVWVLNVQTEHQRDLLRRRNRALRRANADLRALLSVSEELSQPSTEQDLLAFGLEQLQGLVGDVVVGVFIREGEDLVLHAHSGLDSVDRTLIDQALAKAQQWRMWERFLMGDGKALCGAGASGQQRDVYLLPLSSPRTLEGCFAMVLPSDRSLTPQQRHLAAFLARSLGSALEGRRLLEDLRRERDLTMNVLNNLEEGVFVADQAGNIVLGNPAAQSLIAATVGGKVPERLQTTDVGGDGGSEPVPWDDRFLAMRRVPLGGSQVGTTGVVYVVRDVTTELQIRQRQSDFVAYVAHELRTPLTTMHTLMSLLMRDDTPAAKRAEYLAVIASQIERQTKLVRDLLDLSRLEAGHYDLPLDLIDVRDVVREAVAVCQPLALAKEQNVRLDLPEAELLVRSSADGLHQVLINLLSNAIKFTMSGGELGIECESFGGLCRIRVWDKGVGMSPEEQRKLFVKYASRSSQRRQEGTGLGLVISKMILDQLGAKIAVESEPGRGSAFTVSLPLAAVSRRSSADGSSSNILGVCSNPSPLT